MQFKHKDRLDEEYNASKCVSYLEDALSVLIAYPEHDMGDALSDALAAADVFSHFELSFAEEFLDHEIDWWRHEYEDMEPAYLIEEYGIYVDPEEIDDSQIPNKIAQIVVQGALNSMQDWLLQCDEEFGRE